MSVKIVLLTALLSIALLGCQPVAGPSPASQPGLAPAATATSVAEAEAKVKAAEAALAQAKTELQGAVVESRKAKCRWLVAILGIVAAAALAGAWFLPIMRLKLAGAALIALGLIPAVLFVSRFAAYWEWLGAGVLIAAVIGVIVYWHRDHYTLAQVVASVEDVKSLSPDTWKKLKPTFTNRLSQSRKFINQIVGKIKG